MAKKDCGCSDAPAEAADSGPGARPQPDQLEQYAAHFIDPPHEFIRAKADIFQIERGTIDLRPPIFLCATAGRWTRFHPQKRFDRAAYEATGYVHYVATKDLDHLKALAGVPSDVYRALGGHGDGSGRCGFRARPVEMHHLPAEGAIQLNTLSPAQRTAVRDLSLNLLLGPVDAKRAAEAPFKAVVDSMLGRVARLPTFVGKDLFVCPDETVEFIGFGAVYFDNVVVVDNGRMLLGAGTKLHAYQIKHI